MNGSTYNFPPPIVLHGVGSQAERQLADAERVKESPRCDRGRTLANETRGQGPANQFSPCRENWIDSSHALGNGNSRHPQPRQK